MIDGILSVVFVQSQSTRRTEPSQSEILVRGEPKVILQRCSLFRQPVRETWPLDPSGSLGSWVPPLSAALPRPSMRLLYVVLSTASFPCLIITRGDGLRLETLLVTIRHQNDLDKQ